MRLPIELLLMAVVASDDVPPPRTAPADVTLTQPAAPRPLGGGLFARFRGTKPAVPPPPARPDPPVRRAQAAPAELPTPIPPGSPPDALAVPNEARSPLDSTAGQSISLQAALLGAITSNPDLVTLRQGNPNAASPEAVEVARRFPTTLNPTLWIDYRPITLIPRDTFGSSSPAGSGSNANSRSPFYHSGQNYFYISYRQPFELGHQTAHRYEIAKAALAQQRWTISQAELTALVQTYRVFQTAAYRREKLNVAKRLAEFNARLEDTLKKQLEFNAVPAADVVLARVENRAVQQQARAARQDYLAALGDLRIQVGLPANAAAAEPLGEFTLPGYIPPVDEQAMIDLALTDRPDIKAAQAQANGAGAAVRLAKGDRIPSPIIGPEYQIDEAGVQYVGLIFVTQLPFINNGKPLVRQREAEARRACIAVEQARQRVVAQVRSAVLRWNGTSELVNETSGLTADLAREVAQMEQLFEKGQTDLTKLTQARQRLIQLENARLDSVWQATQAQADLLLALGSPALIHGMLDQAEADANPAIRAVPVITPPPAGASPFRP